MYIVSLFGIYAITGSQPNGFFFCAKSKGLADD